MPEHQTRSAWLTAAAAAAAAILLFPLTGEAAKIDWDALEKKAQQYTGESSGNSSSSNSAKPSVNISIPTKTPTGRLVDTSPKMLSEHDTRHITVHMKLANRNFMKKNYAKAIEELELVFERQPDHGGGRFMRAVIAARKRDYMTAWQNILVAQEKDGNTDKIKSFIDKLATQMPKPEKFIGVPGIYRPTPVSVGEKCTDIIERLLNEPVSQNIVTFSTEDYQGSDSNAQMLLKMSFSSPVDADGVIRTLKAASGEAVERTDKGNDGKIMDVKITVAGLPMKNPGVKALSSYEEFVKSMAEETDIAISNTTERDAENKVLEVTYEFAVRDFASLNNFLRKVSPYAHNLRVMEMKLAYIGGSEQVIWKGKVRVDYQL